MHIATPPSTSPRQRHLSSGSPTGDEQRRERVKERLGYAKIFQRQITRYRRRGGRRPGDVKGASRTKRPLRRVYCCFGCFGRRSAAETVFSDAGVACCHHSSSERDRRRCLSSWKHLSAQRESGRLSRKKVWTRETDRLCALTRRSEVRAHVEAFYTIAQAAAE
ncbi:hypothetical protein L596_004612 [Steinernema carpocapsae]|uniref:Uncharacterized protein n=1 Tax=Steinernema carpocapsae TaxID=34508 RepID=A0A4U8V0G5_STECR|nr:hypothetical protein L596_004612 [Steinernema carpocapsae]